MFVTVLDVQGLVLVCVNFFLSVFQMFMFSCFLAGIPLVRKGLEVLFQATLGTHL